jgi:trk system potassium uptake protein TrkA
MKIIIMGAGMVGASLAESLSAENNDITLIDLNGARLNQLQDKYDIRTVQGHCSYPSILRKAGAETADMIIAVTSNDEANMVACQVSYSLFHTPLKIARIRSQEYFASQELYGAENLPIDVFISPEDLVTANLCQLIAYPGALQVLDFANGTLKMVAVKPYYGGPMLGQSIGNLHRQFNFGAFQVVALYRNDHAVPFDQSTIIEIGDEVFFVAASSYMGKIMKRLRRIHEQYQRIIISGGQDLGFTLAKALQDQYQVKIIEKSKSRCEFLSRQLQNVLVFQGEGTDRQLLRNENIENADVFCAVTDDDESNIISCLQAKRLGVRQVMSLIRKTDYIDLIEGGSINIAITASQAAASAILAHVRRGDIVNVYSLRRGAAEAIEIVAHGDQATSRVVGKPLGKIHWPPETHVGSVVRGDEVLIPTNDLVLQSGDHVVLFVTNKRKIRDVEKLFHVSASFF